MEERFIKKYWDDEKITFFIHFENQVAVRQIELFDDGRAVLTSTQNPINGDHMLYDQDLEDLDLNPEDYISSQEFGEAWAKYKTY